MTSTILAVVGIVILTALAFALLAVVKVVSQKIDLLERPESVHPAPLEYDDKPLWDELERLQGLIADQTLAIAEGIEHADRAERRVRAAVQSAKRRAEAAGLIDPGLEAEEASLRENDAGRVEAEPLLALPEDVDADSAWLRIPGRRGSAAS